MLTLIMVTALLLIPSMAFGDELYVVNGLAETLSRINLDSGAVANNVAQLGLFPNDILIVRDTAYIVNSGSDDIYMYDLAKRKKVRTIDVGSGRNPYKMAQIAKDTFLVTNWLANTVTKFTSSGSVIGEYEVGGENPQGILAKGDRSYITTVSFVWQDTSYSTGFVAVWDNKGDSVVKPIAVGENPNDLVFGADGLLYVVCTGEYNGTGSVYVVDPNQMVAVDSLNTGGDPTDIAIVSDGIGYLAAGEGWFPPGSPGHLLTFNPSPLNLLHGLSDPILSDGGVISVLPASDSTVYSLNFAFDTVTELDSSGTILRRFFVGDGPQAAAARRLNAVCDFARGDVNAAGGIDIDDIVYLINYVFGGGPIPVCDGISGNVNCADESDIDDIVYLINYVFSGGPAPCDY
jgi:sugar lactone lactonase YvrE